MKKGILIQDLLNELTLSRFSGYCVLSRRTESGSLVFKNGNCILADYLGLAGNDAWAMVQEAGTQETDAQIVQLTPAQLDLTIEFNITARIEHKKKSGHSRRSSAREQAAEPGQPGSSAPSSSLRPVLPEPHPPSPGKETERTRRKVRPADLDQVSPPGVQNLHAEEQSTKTIVPDEQVNPAGTMQANQEPPVFGAPVSSGSVSPVKQHSPLTGQSDQVPPEIPDPVMVAGNSPFIPPPEVSSQDKQEEHLAGFQDEGILARSDDPKKPSDDEFIRELSTLDELDIKGMSEKIRDNCRMIVRGLHLEHLLEKDDEKIKD
jgi:hypothetical protein